jgi:hypothetical protein
MANGNMNQQQPQQIGANPPALEINRPNNPLEAPEIAEKGRKVTGKTAQGLLSSGAINKEDIVTVRSPRTGSETPFSGAQLVQQFQNAPSEFQNVMKNVVSGEVRTYKLLNNKGEIVRDQYTPDDAGTELRKMNPSDRIGFLNELYKRDFFPSSKGPSATGLDNGSLNAMEQFLNMVNSTGYVMDVAKPMILSTYAPIQGLPGTGGEPRRYSVSAPADIKAIADNVAEQIIGRRLTESQAQQVIKRVQAAERKAGLQTSTEQVQAPSPQVVAQGMIEQQFAPEAQSMRMGDVTKILDDFMRSV